MATRNLMIEADVISGDGIVNHVVWTQGLQFSNCQSYLDNTTHWVCTQMALMDVINDLTHRSLHNQPRALAPLLIIMSLLSKIKLTFLSQ